MTAGDIPEQSGHSPVPGMTLLEQGDGTRPGVSSNLTHPGILISAELHSGKSSRGDLRALGCSKEHPAPPASGSDGACDIPKLLQEEMFPENPRQELIDFQHTQNYILKKGEKNQSQQLEHKPCICNSDSLIRNSSQLGEGQTGNITAMLFCYTNYQ